MINSFPATRWLIFLMLFACVLNIQPALGQLGGLNKIAIDKATAALAKDPRDTSAYKMRAKAYYNTGRMRESLADVAAGMTIDPNDPDLYLQRYEVEAYYFQDRQAKQDLQKANELKSQGRSSSWVHTIPEKDVAHDLNSYVWLAAVTGASVVIYSIWKSKTAGGRSTISDYVQPTPRHHRSE